MMLEQQIWKFGSRTPQACDDTNHTSKTSRHHENLTRNDTRLSDKWIHNRVTKVWKPRSHMDIKKEQRLPEVSTRRMKTRLNRRTRAIHHDVWARDQSLVNGDDLHEWRVKEKSSGRSWGLVSRGNKKSHDFVLKNPSRPILWFGCERSHPNTRALASSILKILLAALTWRANASTSASER